MFALHIIYLTQCNIFSHSMGVGYTVGTLRQEIDRIKHLTHKDVRQMIGEVALDWDLM